MAERELTAGEIVLARAAFGELIDYPGVRIVDGPGMSFAAHIAFMRGNPAITLGATVYFKEGHHSADFSAPGAKAASFIHEMTHVWQYRELGQAAFFLRYGKDLAEVGFSPDDLYKYDAGETQFKPARLEAQAAMVEDYSVALWRGDDDGAARLAKNLAGSGIYGL